MEGEEGGSRCRWRGYDSTGTQKIILSHVSEPCDDPGKQELLPAALACQNFHLISLSDVLQFILNIQTPHNNLTLILLWRCVLCFTVWDCDTQLDWFPGCLVIWVITLVVLFVKQTETLIYWRKWCWLF